MIIATIRSLIYPKIVPQGLEPGFYELKVSASLEQASLSGDPGGFCQMVLAEHLAVCVASTGIPLYEKCWTIEFSKFMQDNFNYPKELVT